MRQSLLSRFMLAALLMALVSATGGCKRDTDVTPTNGPQPPLESTNKTTEPPPGCRDLRKRGGAC